VFYLAFARYFPILPIAELKTILKSSGESYKNDTAPVRPKYTPVVNSFVPTEEPLHDEHAPHNGLAEEIIEEKTVKLSDDEKGERISALIEKLGAGNADEKDDLKLISGVDPKLEEILNGIGIFTFEQVSKMSKEEYDLLDTIIVNFPGRAERDDWAEQAKNLMNK
jgi:molybdopterin-containing oxidoreductase family membrane subunit